MFRRSSKWLAALLLLVAPAKADLLLTHSGTATPAAAGCSQATAFIAREDGSQTNNSAITTMICGMVTDGTWSLLDGLYIFATNDATNAKLNLVSSSFSITPQSSPTFTAGQGYAGNGTSSYLDTGFNASTAPSPNFTLNSATVGAYDLTNRSTDNSCVIVSNFSSDASTSYAYIQPKHTTALYGAEVNAYTFAISGASANAQGSWLATRTSSSTITLYRNGSSLQSSSSDPSTNIQNGNIIMLAFNDAGSLSDFCADQLSAGFMGGGMNATQAGNVQSRINAYMSSLGINVY